MVADGLTLTRLVIAVALVSVAWAGELTPVAILVSLAWVTDLLDGKLARAGPAPGRWGARDLDVDTAVGAGLLIGLIGSGAVTPWLMVPAAAFAWGHRRGNVAAAMLLQLCGYVPLLLLLWLRRPWGWPAPFVTAALVAMLDWRRLVLVNIPGFLGSLRRW